MSLANPRIIYGVHSISPYHRTSRLPYGILKVVGSAEIALSSSIEQLYAGSNKFSWAAEAKTISSEIKAKVKAYPGFLFELFLGATVTDSGADTAGAVSTLTDRLGGSLVDASTGVASVSVLAASKANLKFGKYVAKVLTSTTIGIYLYSDIDINRGTDVSYFDDTLLLTLASTITIVSATNTDVADLGLRFAGGAGVISMTVGDTASFEVKPPSDSSSLIVIGGSNDTFPAFGALMLAQKRATTEMFEIDASNVVAAGLPIALQEQAFSQPEVTLTCLYDSVLDRVFSIRHILPS